MGCGRNSSPSDLRERQAAELPDAADEAGDGGQLRQTVAAHGVVGVHDEDGVEVAVDGRPQAGRGPDGALELEVVERVEQRPARSLIGRGELPLGVVG